MSCIRRSRLLLALGLALAFAPHPVHAQKAPEAEADPDADCLACHNQPDLKSDSGRSVFVDTAKHNASVHANLNCITCHTDIKEFPHPAKIAKVKCSSCHEEPADDISKSVHEVLSPEACSSCHGPAHYVLPGATIAPKICSSCHADQVKEFLSGIHAKAAKNGDKQSPSCETCHGPVHKILPADNPASRVAKKNLPVTCGSCHSNPDFLSKHQIPIAHPVETFSWSVHGRALAAGNPAAPSCSDCHASHAIFPARDSRSKINHWNVPATCGACHTEIEKIYDQSVHGQAVAHSVSDAPVCTDCHGEHNILATSNPLSPVNPARVSDTTCGRCHGDERLNARYDLPPDRVPSFANSFHGLESRAGGQTVANCASCHGTHNIFRSSDPRSTVNPANLARTCGACHPGAGEKFAIGPVHILAQSRSEHIVVKSIRWFYWIMIPLAIAFMFSHHLLDFLRKFLHPHPRIDSGAEIMRMNLHFRIAHWLTVASFPVLVFTGFALKFPESWWAQPLLLWESRFGFRGVIHRLAAVVLLSSVGYHIVHLTLVRRDRAILRYILPGLRDMQDMVGMFLYNLGLSGTRPTFGKFNYIEKIEYLAYMWGTAVMALTGFILWFNNLALRYFPKWVSDAATALHFYEAILATFSILIWHMYTVIFDPDVYPMDRSWLTGKASADHLRHTRPAYYEELLKEEEQRKDPPAEEKPSPKPPVGSG